MHGSLIYRILKIPQKFNRQYESASKFQAHNHLILASTFTIYNNRPIFVTGGNDNTIAIWDVRDCVSAPASGKKSSNGKSLPIKSHLHCR